MSETHTGLQASRHVHQSTLQSRRAPREHSGAWLQVHAVAAQLVQRTIWLVPGTLVGGENRHHEKQRLRKGVTILVATPGRLLDHLQSTAAFVTSNLAWLVLDEADRLMDLGFEATLRAIVGKLSERCGGSRCAARCLA